MCKHFKYSDCDRVRTLQWFSRICHQNFREAMLILFDGKKSIFRYINQYFANFLVLKHLKYPESLHAYESCTTAAICYVSAQVKHSGNSDFIDKYVRTWEYFFISLIPTSLSCYPILTVKIISEFMGFLKRSSLWNLLLQFIFYNCGNGKFSAVEWLWRKSYRFLTV